MPLYLDTERRARVAVAICGRCSMKMSIEELSSDPNSPGLMVCSQCKDDLDPWRLPPRATENITLRAPRPDTPIPNAQNYSYQYTAGGSFTPNEILVGQCSGVTAKFVSAVGSTLNVTQLGGLSFSLNEVVIGSTSGSTGVITSQQGVT